MNAHDKVIRRIRFYIFIFGCVIIRAATDKHDWISWTLFAVVSVYSIVRLVDDIGELRKMKETAEHTATADDRYQPHT